MRAIFRKRLVHETSFNTVIYREMKCNIIMHTLKYVKMESTEILEIISNILFMCKSSNSRHKEMLLESLNIPYRKKKYRKNKSKKQNKCTYFLKRVPELQNGSKV